MSKMFVSTVDACVPGQRDAVEDGVVGRHASEAENEV